MNIANKLTLAHLKENKSRTVITILGICVSVAMITAVFVAIASFMNLFGEIEMISSGNKHAELYVTESQLEQLEKDERIERVGIECSLEYDAFELTQKKSSAVGTGNIYSGDYVNLQQMFTGDYDGTIPKNENEIAVEQSLIDKNNLDWKIGDTVKISIGNRIINDDGEEMVISGTYSSLEYFKTNDVQEFTITAILHNNPSTFNSYKIIRGFDSSSLNLADSETVVATVELKQVNYKSLNALKDIAQQYNIKDYQINKDYLETKFAVDKDGYLMKSLVPMAMIILVLIMIASVVLIYNAFAMSLSERVRYLGMLSSVGATKRQKKSSVYFEGFILGAVGIPVGILAGIFGIGVTLKVIGKKIISTGMIQGVSDTNMNIDVVVPLWAIVAIVFFSALTIFISSVIPSRKASAITPIDAIRQRNEIKVKSKKLKAPKIVRKVFDYEGELAYKNLKRNGRKSRVIIASISLSIVLFLSCNYFCQLFIQANNMQYDIPYQVTASINYEQKNDFYKDLENIDGVDKFYLTDNYCEQGSLDTSFANKDFLTTTYKNLFNGKNLLYINQLDDEDFNKLCENNGVDYTQYYDKSGETVKALIMNNVSHNTTSSKVFNDKIIGAKYRINDGYVQVSDFVSYDSDDYICNLNPKSSISLYVPYSVYNAVLRLDDETEKDWICTVGIETDQHEQVADNLIELIQGNDKYSGYVNDYVSTMESMNTMVFILQVFVYGFITLITLITIANIINTISTGIALRRKEFAMLKSVGTTPKGFRKMISLESLLYGIKAVLIGIPISLLLSVVMNKTLGDDSIPFEINWLLYLMVIVVVLLIVGFSMLYSVSKLKNDSIIETLKEDIS